MNRKPMTRRITRADKRLYLIFSVPFLLIMTTGLLQFSYGLVPFALFGAALIIIGGLILGLIAQVIERHKKTRINRWLLLISLLTFVSVVAFFMIARVQGAVTKQRAEQLIAALDRYYADHQRYPGSLAPLLHPTYLGRTTPRSHRGHSGRNQAEIAKGAGPSATMKISAH